VECGVIETKSTTMPDGKVIWYQTVVVKRLDQAAIDEFAKQFFYARVECGDYYVLINHCWSPKEIL
jgi:hypothetical protein